MKSFAAFCIIVTVFALLAAATTSGAPQTTGRTTAAFSGAMLFDNYCATCHGAKATGDGLLAPHLRKQPANLTLLAQRNGGTFSREMVMRIIDGRKPLSGHGGGDMPVWGDAFDRSADGQDTTPTKIAALVVYLESIQRKP